MEIEVRGRRQGARDHEPVTTLERSLGAMMIFESPRHPVQYRRSHGKEHSSRSALWAGSELRQGLGGIVHVSLGLACM